VLAVHQVGNRKLSWETSHDLPEYDAVVIGSGQAGLSCASVLSQFGQRVLVLEQHEVTGGGAHTFSVEGKEGRFDSGLHFTVPQHELLLQLTTGAASPPVRTPKLGESDGTYERIAFASGDQPPLALTGGVPELADALKQRFPGHKRAIEHYFALSERVQLRFALWIVSALLPMWLRVRMLRSPLMEVWRRWAAVSTATALESLFPGDDAETHKLRTLASGLWLDTGSPPSRMSFWMQTAVFGGFQVLGAGYPEGGPQEMALAMVESIEARGGAVYVRCPVESIAVDRSTGKALGVTLPGGRLIRAKRVVSGIGWRKTMAMLPPDSAPPRQPVTSQSCGFVMGNITLSGTAEELGISSANMWIQPSSEANGYNAIKGIDDFMAAPLKVDRRHLALGITFPSCKDRTHEARHPGVHCCQILAPAEWRHFERFVPLGAQPPSRHAPPHAEREKSKEYAAVKQQWADRMLDALHTHYPATRGRVTHVDISTPLTIENFLRPGNGAAIGLDVTPARFVDEDEVRVLDMRSHIPGLWLCGQDVLMCGQVLAAASGTLCALRMLGPLTWLRFAFRAVRLLTPTAAGVVWAAMFSRKAGMIGAQSSSSRHSRKVS